MTGGGGDPQLKQEADAKKKKLAQDAKDRIVADKKAKLEVDYLLKYFRAAVAVKALVLVVLHLLLLASGVGVGVDDAMLAPPEQELWQPRKNPTAAAASICCRC